MPWTCLAMGTMLASGESARIVAAVVTGTLGGVIGAFVTAHLALRKHRMSQWWDEQFRLYQEILIALNETQESADIPDPAAPGASPWPDDLRKSMVAKGTLLLSKEALRRLNEFEAFFQELKSENKWQEKWREGRASLLKDLASIARRDLGVGPLIRWDGLLETTCPEK